MIDQDALRRLQEWGGPKLVREMVRLFLDNSPERLEQIRAGFEEKELKAVERACHSLKSSAANVGAAEVSQLAERMEDLAEAGDESEALALQDGLRAAHARAIRALEEFLEGVSP